MKKIVLVSLITLLFSHCSSKKEEPNCDELRANLDNIKRQDQKYRVQENQIVERYGYYSKEHKDILELIELVDQKNSKAVSKILDDYGYPQLNCIGRSAASAPILVIHHSPSSQGLRYKYFDTIYKGYQNGDVDKDLFALYLERMYMLKYDKYLEMRSPYKTEEKVDSLIKVLELKN